MVQNYQLTPDWEEESCTQVSEPHGASAAQRYAGGSVVKSSGGVSSP